MAAKKKTSKKTTKKKTTRKKSEPKRVEALRHGDKRKNIPTEELRDFVARQEAAPDTMLYPRDPSLDPQLVWKGKDEQDREDLAVPAVPVYIQEKIQPQAIIEEVRKQSEALEAKNRVGEDGPQYNMEQSDIFDQFFSDFNGLPEEFDQRVDFYQHEGHWQNRMILGDSLMIMTSLAEKEGLKGQVQTIYLDPPYGIKFGSNWQVSTRKRDVRDGRAEDATRQPEQVRAFRDTWKLGIHSYLSYLRDRLTGARELLTETGSCFVQIGDENVHLVRCLMDEVFGSENFVTNIMFQKSGAFTSAFLPAVGDFVLWYSKNRDQMKFRSLFADRFSQGIPLSYDYIDLDGRIERMPPEKKAQLSSRSETQKIFQSVSLTSSHEYSLGREPFLHEGKTYSPGSRYWSTSPSGMKKLQVADRLLPTSGSLRYKMYLNDFPVSPLNNMWGDVMGASGIIYVVQTTSKVVERCLLMTTDPGDLVLDPTCGSGTTAYVAEQWGRRWITCDTSRVALALARTRLMSARFPYYYLSQCYPQAAQMGADDKGIRKHLREASPAVDPEKADVRKGFVYKRVPHITLKSIANNPDIKEGMTREQIDAAIARHADFETLYDQPYEDKKTVRVCGPFTVESLSPHRVLSPADEDQDGALSEEENAKRGDFAQMILENLKKAGVQNTIKDERLKFDTLEPYAGEWIQAEGTYTDAAGKTRRVAVSIGPEQGTVGPMQVKEAAKEAVMGIGFDLLVVCGFSFDPHVSEETKRYGMLQVLPTRMNPDLSMGDELLKKTGAGNLFMVFGEPDIEITEIKDTPENKIQIELKGLDIYDPTTGQIRSSSTDDIACWFIDSDYNGESFFVRHAYFTGADEPYDKLKRALRAEINEEAWDSLYRTESRPFPKPEGGKIAIKVINHYGDEVLKTVTIQ